MSTLYDAERAYYLQEVEAGYIDTTTPLFDLRKMFYANRLVDWYPHEAVVLQKGGTYDTIKKAVDAAGNSPIMVVPTWRVAASGADFTTIGGAIADAGVLAGDIILVLDGTYNEANTTVSKAVHIVGQSRTGTILTASDADSVLTFTADASFANLRMNSVVTATSNVTLNAGLLNVYGYNTDIYTSSDGIADAAFGGLGTWELRHVQIFTTGCGTLTAYTGAGNLTVILDRCYLETGGPLNNAACIKNFSDACTITARYTTFANVPTDFAGDALACLYNGQGTMSGTFDHCYFLEDLSACPSVTGGELTALLAGASGADDISLIDCIASVLVPSGKTITAHLKRSAGTLRQVNTTVPSGQTYTTSGTITAAYKIDPLAL